MDNSHFNPLRTDKEIKAFYDEMRKTPEDSAYMDRVNRMLSGMKPGASIVIANIVDPANLEKFIKCVCLYADAWPSERIKFSEDYQKVIKDI